MTSDKTCLHRVGLALCLGACAGAPQAAIINGDFSDGLNGWTVSGGIAPSLVSAQDQAGNGYAAISSGQWQLQQVLVNLRQQVLVEAGATELVADFAFLGADPDPSQPVPQPDPQTGLFPSWDIFGLTVDTASGLRGAFFTDQVLGTSLVTPSDPLVPGVGVALNSPTDAFFDQQVVADLTPFIGELVTLSFSLIPGNDAAISRYAVDNVALRAAAVAPGPGPNGVPAPAPLALLLTGLLIGVRRRVGGRDA